MIKKGGISKGGLHKSPVSPSFSALDFDRFPPSVANLTASLTINGITVQPTFRYNGNDANASGWKRWGYGQDLVISSTGLAPNFSSGSYLLGDLDGSVYFNGGQYYSNNTTTFGNLDSDDCVFEIIVYYPGNMELIKKVNAPYTNGWDIGCNTGGLHTPYVAIRTNGGTAYLPSATLLPNTWNFIQYFFNRDENSTNGAKCYVNGLLSNSINPSAAAVGTNSTTNMVVGKSDDANSGWGGIGYFSMWRYPSWFAAGAASPTEWASLAMERYSQLMGLRPQIARGSVVPNFSRSSVAYTCIDKSKNGGNKRMYRVSSNVPRICCKVDTTGKLVRGYYSEPSSTNLCLQSEFLNTTWTAVALTSISTNSMIGPDGLTTMDGLVGTAVNTQHGVSQAITLTASPYVFSCFVKKGNYDWCYLANSTVANATAYFYIGNEKGYVGSVGAGCSDSGIEYWGSGLYRIWIVFAGTVAAHTFQIYAANANLDNDFAGDATAVNLYAGFVQCEVGLFPSSYIATTTVVAQRQPDVLFYSGTGNVVDGIGTVEANVLNSNFSLKALTSFYVLDINIGGLLANSIGMNISTLTGKFEVFNYRGGSEISRINGSSNLFSTLVEKKLKYRYYRDAVEISVNDVLEIISWSATQAFAPANSFNQINIGTYSVSAYAGAGTTYGLNGLINKVKIYPKNRSLRSKK